MQYDECPRCGRTCVEALSSNWFPVFKCTECDTHYCNECGNEGECPECGAGEYSEVGKVYAPA